MDYIIHSNVGLFHTLIAITAMLSGAIVILNKKGTLFHKRVGYVYVASMLLLNITAFFIVNFGGFSMFHFFAILSLFTVLAGIIPAIFRIKKWFGYHFYFMSWSVVGLYAAFWAELGTRFVKNIQQFWWIVALATFMTVFVGAIIIKKQAKKINLK